MSDEINHDRRRFFGTAAMTIAAAQLTVAGCAVQGAEAYYRQLQRFSGALRRATMHRGYEQV
jgi:nitrous oxide reductase